MEKKSAAIYVLGEGKGVYKELGSEFIALLFPVSDPESYKAKEEEFRKRFPKADHYPYAYRIKGNGRSSDDGEPGGSAGRPMLSLLEEKGIEDAAILVARYFGGSKLGIPRLRKAFLAASNDAIDNAKLAKSIDKLSYTLEVDYPVYERLKGLSERNEFLLKANDFGVKVNITLLSDGKIDGLLEKKGILLPLPEPIPTSLLEELL